MNEVWKTIEGYEGLYEVSNLGRVRSLNYRGSKGRIEILKRYKITHKTGYVSVRLQKNCKKTDALLHRLVAKAFVPNPLNLPDVNHKDEDKANNIPENLEWCTKAYNNKYGTRTSRAAASRRKRSLKI